MRIGVHKTKGGHVVSKNKQQCVISANKMPRTRVQTAIEKNALKELDVKIAYSDFLKDRSSYFEFLITLLPFIPNDIRPGMDPKEVIRIMCENSGIEISSEPVQKDQSEDRELDEKDRKIAEMAKNFRLKTSAKENIKNENRS